MAENEAIWKKLDVITGDIQRHETKIALVEQEQDHMRTETTRIAAAVDKQTECMSKLSGDLRVLMVKFACLIAIIVGVIEAGLKIWKG